MRGDPFISTLYDTICAMPVFECRWHERPGKGVFVILNGGAAPHRTRREEGGKTCIVVPFTCGTVSIL